MLDAVRAVYEVADQLLLEAKLAQVFGEFSGRETTGKAGPGETCGRETAGMAGHGDR